MLPLRHEASTRTGAASPRKSCQSPPCQCYEFRLPVARVNPPRRTWRPGGVLCDDTRYRRMNPPCKTWRPGGVLGDDTRYRRMNPLCKPGRPGGVLGDDTRYRRMNPPCKTWRPGGVQHDDAQYQRMNPPCKTWRPGGVQGDNAQCHRMNPPCKTARPRKSKTRTRDAIRPHNRKRRAPLPRATSIVTNSATLSRACVFQRRLATGDDFLESVERHYQERRPSAQTRAAGVSPPWVQELHLQPMAKVAGWLLASAARRGLVGAGVSVVYRECYAVAFGEPRLAYASRSWLLDVRCLRNARFTMPGRICDRSSDRQPAVAR
jgi:hypothetical protein